MQDEVDSGSPSTTPSVTGSDILNASVPYCPDIVNSGRLKFGSSDDLMALAAQSFAGTRTAKIINQFKEWDSTHSVETAISKTNSSDNLLETVPGRSLSKYYDDYNADKAKASRRTVMEDIVQNKDDIENQGTPDETTLDEKKLHGFAKLLENIFHIEERGNYCLLKLMLRAESALYLIHLQYHLCHVHEFMPLFISFLHALILLAINFFYAIYEDRFNN